MAAVKGGAGLGTVRGSAQCRLGTVRVARRGGSNTCICGKCGPSRQGEQRRRVADVSSRGRSSREGT
jgi:hypothetical protein